MKKLLFFALFMMMAISVYAVQPPLVGDGNGTKIQGFAPSAIANYYLTKSTTVPLTYFLAVEVQTDQDTKMYLGSDATNYYTIYSGVPETFVVNATQAVFKIASSAVTSSPNLRILYH